MSDNSQASSAAQLVATIRHENILLHRHLAEMQHENLLLKRQLYRLGALLDIAVSKLSSRGIALETPIPIRELRAAIPSHDIMDTLAEARAPTDLSYENAAAQDSRTDRFQLRHELRGHAKPVQCAAFAMGNQPILASSGLDCHLVLHDFWTGEKVHEINAHEQNVVDVAWFEGSGNLLSASFDGTVKVWDPRHANREAEPVYKIETPGFVLAAAVLDKAFTFVCTDSKRHVSIVDMRVPKPISWRLEVRANTVAFNGADSQLVTGHNDGHIAVWDLRKVGSLFSSISPSTEGATSISSIAASSSGTGLLGEVTSASVPLVTRVENEPSHSPITCIISHNKDDSKRLLVVSADNMVRLYGGVGLNPSTHNSFTLRNVVGGLPIRGYTARAAFWRGTGTKTNVSSFFDDGEREGDARSRHLTECDIMVTCGAENTACIYDVTEKGTAVLIEKLKGHRDRVVGAAVHPADRKPVIATYSADNTVRIWAPAKN
ncbi:hypothetical protein TRVL_02311 [Trypanosoma vivax]|nr:hypothetical protein TRVL_02311 [Trypanosoma vivax]